MNCDCLDWMKGLPDKAYELAIVDPPYGIGEGNKKNRTRSSFTGFGGTKKWVKANDYGGGEFDFNIPDENYYNQLFRVSRDQIIWGANYMVEYLSSSMGWIVWDKDNGESDQSDCELAYTSIKTGLRKFTYRWQGLLQQNMLHKETRIHPTQKPVALYKWLLRNYAKPGDKILDTHGGSFSHAIACYDLGFDLDIMEIDVDYFKAGKERYESHVARYAPASEIPVTKKGEFKLF